MKNYSYIGISLVILIFGILMVPEIIDRIGEDKVVSSNRTDTRGEESVSSEPLSYVLVNGKKKKVPAFQFTDQNGKTITNEDYKGKVFIAEFFFTTCPTICPIMNENLVAVQDEFETREDFGIASFTIDPVHDTPEVLKNYAELNGIDHPNWHLMTGEREAIFQLANSGFNIYAGRNAAAQGGFEHSGYFALVDQEGYIRSREDSFGNPIIYYKGSVARNTSVGMGEEGQQIDMLIQDVKKLLADGDQE